MRLRSLYIDQLYRLKHVLREKRRNYLHAIRTERETLCSIHDQSKDTIAERQMYEKLKALNKYQRRNGVEAIMYKKFLEKRQKVSKNSHHQLDTIADSLTFFPLFHCPYRVEMEWYNRHRNHHSMFVAFSLRAALNVVTE